MNLLVAHAQPESGTFSTALKNAALEVFSQPGHVLQVSDLYAMGFSPVASGG